MSGMPSFPPGWNEHFSGAQSLAQYLQENGASPDEFAEAMAKYARGDHPEGQDPAKGLLSAWGSFMGVPLEMILYKQNMTLEQAADIAASGIPTSEAKLIQYVAAKAFLSVAKSSGAENITTYAGLKEQLRNQNLNNIAKQDSRLNIAIKGDGTGKVDFGMGTGSQAEAERLGKIWVGDGARQTSNGGWISADGTRGYRAPSPKDSPFATTGTQANFETFKFDDKGNRIKVGNGHLNILE